MENESENLLIETIEHFHKQINDLFVVKNFIEEQILITEQQDIVDDFKTAIDLIKYNCFLIASYIDLLTSFKGIINFETKWDIVFNSKNGFLSIYETIKTYNSHQRKIKKLINEYHPNLLEGYNELNKNLKSFKKKYSYETKISLFRNKAGGHYHENYDEYYEQIQSLETEMSKKAIADFANLILTIMNFVSIIIDELEAKTRRKAEKSKSKWELLNKRNK